MEKPKNPHALSQHGWSQEQKDCPHPKLEFSTDNSCGGWFEKCTVCKAYVNGGMMGHN